MLEGKNKFEVVEASVADLHEAIRNGRAKVVEVVQKYIDRVRAYNGVSSMLVTENGKEVPKVDGVIRGGMQLTFPTRTKNVAEVLPDLDKYKGPPLEFGRMEINRL